MAPLLAGTRMLPRVAQALTRNYTPAWRNPGRRPPSLQSFESFEDIVDQHPDFGGDCANNFGRWDKTPYPSSRPSPRKTIRSPPDSSKLPASTLDLADQYRIVDKQLLFHPVGRGKAPIPIPGQTLRELCRCTECRNPDTQQLNINVFKNRIMGEVEAVSEDVENYNVLFRDGHQAVIRRKKVMELNHVSLPNRTAITVPVLWNSAIAQSPPRVSYDLQDPSAMMKALTGKLKQFGFVLVEGMPVSPEATQSLLESIGPIRNTHYGGFYDFTADLASKDTAYTSEALEPHTDNTYFTEAAGLQALHMLSHTEGSGGESILVDGFNVAEELRINHPLEHNTLLDLPVWGHASGNEGISIQPAMPRRVLQQDKQHKVLRQVSWNNADRCGITKDWYRQHEWLNAARLFDESISKPENRYQFQLVPGTTLIFDNWRVLHGRTSFTGIRRMCGGYINRDDWISRWKMHHLSKEELEDSTV